jgi:hypothetical protein
MRGWGGGQVILKQLDIIDDENVKKNMLKKMAPPLVTLLSAESEIQYVALRNISLIVQKYPQILAHEVKVCGPALPSDFKNKVCCAACATAVYIPHRPHLCCSRWLPVVVTGLLLSECCAAAVVFLPAVIKRQDEGHIRVWACVHEGIGKGDRGAGM